MSTSQEAAGKSLREMELSPSAYWKETWKFRELIYVLSWRDIKIRYKQTLIGAAWSVLRPLLTTIIFTIVFSRIVRVAPTSAAPYALMVYAGMLPWQFFSNALNESSNSLIGSAGLISKIYFPRVIIPISALLTNLVDFGISVLILIAMMCWYGFAPVAQVACFPVFVVLLLFLVFGAGLFFTAMNVRYRDFKFLVPFLLQVGIYITPVAFSSANVPSAWRLLYSLNPMTGIIDGFRWCLLGDAMYWPGLWISGSITVLLLISGLRYFRIKEKSFGDHI